ncbi:MAG: hypothetical protein ACOC6A_02985 [Chloroflexota bacterium]
MDGEQAGKRVTGTRAGADGPTGEAVKSVCDRLRLMDERVVEIQDRLLVVMGKLAEKIE